MHENTNHNCFIDILKNLHKRESFNKKVERCESEKKYDISIVSVK